MAQNNRTHENRIQRLEYWRDGNGSIGAEARLQIIEKKSQGMITEGRMKEIIEKTVLDVLKHEDARGRDDHNAAVNTWLLVVAVGMLAVNILMVGYQIFGG